jgi:hypothetical protein
MKSALFEVSSAMEVSFLPRLVRPVAFFFLITSALPEE